MSRQLLALTLTALFLGSITLAFAGRKKPPTPEEMCTGRQVSVYDGCRKEGGSEDHCWQYSRQKYKDCMNEYALNKRLKESQATVGGASDQPSVQTSTPKPLPKKPIDSGRVQKLNETGDRKTTAGAPATAGKLPSSVEGPATAGKLRSAKSKPTPSPTPRK